jgi:hypothetical protein
MTWSDGRKHVGQYSGNQKNGYGTFYDSNGTVSQQGWWENDKFVKAQAPQVVAPVVPKLVAPISNPQDIKRQKCIRLGLATGSADFQQCMN